MATRSERLNRLATGFTCKASWDGMAGEGPRRHCAECCRDVLDFAQLTPRDVEAHLAASRGQLCGRLTRRDGRLVTAPVAEPAFAASPFQPSPVPRRRAPAVAATLVSAWLAASAGTARAGAAPPAEAVADGDAAARAPGQRQADTAATAAPAPPEAALRGQIHDDTGAALPGASVTVRNTLAGTAYEAVSDAGGSFAFDDLPLGTYDLLATLEGFAPVELNDGIVLRAGVRMNIEVTATAPVESVTMGAMVVAAEPLRRLFDGSELVVVAVAGPSFVAERHDDFATAATELRIETVVKGPAELRRVSYRHEEYADDESGAIDLAGELVPGTRLLAFLRRSGDEATDRRAPAFEASDYRSVKLLGEAELTAYLRRLEALQRAEVRAARHGGDLGPEELVEWLVGTVEDPLTRGEATDELGWALDALAERADASSLTPAQEAADLLDLVDRFRGEGGRLQTEAPPFVLGAFVGDEHRQRLTAALAATAGIRDADQRLFALVRRWDEAASLAWLGAQLGGSVDEADAEDLDYWLRDLVEQMGDASLTALVEAAAAREEEIKTLWLEDETERTRALREEKLQAVRAELRRQLAAALAGPR
jgi:hypothetical protein